MPDIVNLPALVPSTSTHAEDLQTADIVQLVEQFNATSGKKFDEDFRNVETEEADRKVLKSALDCRREATVHAVIRDLWALAEQIRPDLPRARYTNWLLKCGFKDTANPVDNPYTRFVHGVFREWNEEAREYTMLRSASGYANALRWLFENSIPSSEVVKTIDAFPGKLEGIKRADRERHQTVTQRERLLKLRKQGKNLAPMATVPISATLSPDTDLVKMWGRKNGNFIEIVYLSPANESELESKYYNLGVAASKSK